MHYTFECQEHQEYGGKGWALVSSKKWKHYNEPFGGLAVAHDILEHTPQDTGTYEDEYRALGASLYVRNFEDAANAMSPMGFVMHDTASSLASEFVRMYQNANHSLRDVKPCKIHGVNEALEDLDWFFAKLGSELRRQGLVEIRSSGGHRKRGIGVNG